MWYVLYQNYFAYDNFEFMPNCSGKIRNLYVFAAPELLHAKINVLTWSNDDL